MMAWRARLLFSRWPPLTRPTTTRGRELYYSAARITREQTGGGKRLKEEDIGGGGVMMEKIGGGANRAGLGGWRLGLSIVGMLLYHCGEKK
jgi:hypothetical protein